MHVYMSSSTQRGGRSSISLTVLSDYLVSVMLEAQASKGFLSIESLKLTKYCTVAVVTAEPFEYYQN